MTKNWAEILNLLKIDKNPTFENLNYRGHSRDIVIHTMSKFERNLKWTVEMRRENGVFIIKGADFLDSVWVTPVPQHCQ